MKSYILSVRKIRSLAGRLGGDLDAEQAYWTAEIERFVSELDKMPISKVNPWCELLVDLLTFINLTLFLVNLFIVRK